MHLLDMVVSQWYLLQSDKIQIRLWGLPASKWLRLWCPQTSREDELPPNQHSLNNVTRNSQKLKCRCCFLFVPGRDLYLYISDINLTEYRTQWLVKQVRKHARYWQIQQSFLLYLLIIPADFDLKALCHTGHSDNGTKGAMLFA